MEDYNERECQDFIDDTVGLLKEKQIAELSSIASSAGLANELTRDVEFWRWMGKNYPKDFGSAGQIAEAAGSKPFWTRIQLQGKGYEWDWMNAQRGKITNVF